MSNYGTRAKPLIDRNDTGQDSIFDYLEIPILVTLKSEEKNPIGSIYLDTF